MSYVHGTWAGVKAKCPCERCRSISWAAERRYTPKPASSVKIYQQRSIERRALMDQEATRGTSYWTAEEDAVILLGLSMVETAARLGRTTGAVNNRRFKLRHGTALVTGRQGTAGGRGGGRKVVVSCNPTATTM